MDAITAPEESPTGGGESYLVLALAVGIPCGVVILVLIIIIIVIIYLTLQSSSSNMDVEATYMRRRFQGLSLEEQRRIAARQKKRKKSARITRRRSSAATESSKSSKSSVKLTPYSRRAKITRANPFGLQDWQLKMTGIEVSTPGTEDAVFDDDYDEPHSPIGALNPLLLDDAGDSIADYEPVAQKTQKPSSDKEESSSEDDASSSDSMNPYD